ncbi:MAG TPA: hypothetical protein VHU89_06800 [Acidobacteriaceae bacterium]|jgi:hypothetical protein|nr:hypothetical protein [Acidobacteriaceae bacterium]
MNHRILSALVLSSFVLPIGIAAAQTTPPPNVLVIQREYLKPGMTGSIHARSEGNFVRAQEAAKWPIHYIAMDSMSGPVRALFISSYDSLDAWGKAQEAQNASANTTLAAAIDQASQTDGELLSSYDSQTFVYHPEMSVHAAVDVPHQRYWEITSFRIKPGHDKEWSELVKMYVDGFNKIPDAHWALFEDKWGEKNGGVWISINPMRSLAEADKGMADSKAFFAAEGDANMQHAAELAASCIEATQTNVFVVNPKESYVNASWATTAPEIYGQP